MAAYRLRVVVSKSDGSQVETIVDDIRVSKLFLHWIQPSMKNIPTAIPPVCRITIQLQ